MSMAACVTAIEAMWTANWARAEPVIWHENTSDAAPAASHWLHLSVTFSEDIIRAFGGGRLQNERLLRGSVVMRGFAQRGRGEATLLAMLDGAMTALRGQRAGDLSFVGANLMPEAAASGDGIWWMRTAVAVFEYRFRG